MSAGLPRFLLSSRIMSLFVLHRPHGMHVFNRLPDFFSSRVDLLGSRPVKTQSYVIHDDDDDDYPIQDYSSSVYRCCVQELCISSFIPLEVFMILVSIGMSVQWRVRAVLPTYRRGRSMDGSPRASSRDQALPTVCALPRDESEDDVCPTACYYSKHQETTDPTRRPR